MTEDRITKALEGATKSVKQLNQIGQICLLHTQGADAEACIERIKKIIIEG